MATPVIIEAKVNERSVAESVRKGIKSGARSAGPINVDVNIPNVDLKKFQLPLGRISGDLNQFQSSLDASVARVLAFGASASVLAGVSSALRGIVEAGIEVESKLAEINSILNLTGTELAGFSSSLFDIARNTAQSFDSVGSAAIELSRQGLSAQETLKRLNDALILSRLSGLDAAKAVDTLTATINGFSQEAISSTEIVNRLASVDAAFAVSTKDLADALARSGAVAQDAGVSFNQLISIVTAVQQATARGGSVIGNGFKTIFTRIQRSDVRNLLESIGVSTTDLSGNFRGAIPILQDYAKVYQTLSDVQKSQTAESVAGVFQINTLKALLKDLNKEYSVYSGALDIASSATNEATLRNDELNKTTAALLSQTTTSLKEFGAALSSLAAEQGIRNVLNIVNTVAKSLSDLLNEEKGSLLAKSIVGGIGNFIAGPGIVIIGGALLKLLKFLGSEVALAFKQIQSLNAGKQEQQKIEAAIGNILKQNSDLLSKIVGAEGNRKAQQELILSGIRQQEQALKGVLVIQQAIARAASSGQVSIAKGGAAKVTGKANGYVPNFSQPKSKPNASETISETMAARSAGYEPGKVYKTKLYDGQGSSFKSVVNEAETVKTVIGPNGKKGTYVINPLMAAKGFVPNFEDTAVRTEGTKTNVVKPFDVKIPNSILKIGVVAGIPGKGKAGNANTSSSLGVLTSPNTTPLISQFGEKSKISINGIPVSQVPGGISKESDFRGRINKYFSKTLGVYASSITKQVFGEDAKKLNNKIRKDTDAGNYKLFDKGTEGGIFESALRLMAGNAESFTNDSSESAPFDFNPTTEANQFIQKMFNNQATRADAKRSANDKNIRSLINKSLNDADLYPLIKKQIEQQTGQKVTGKPQPAQKKSAKGTGRSGITKEITYGGFSTRRGSGSASGYIPNFAIGDTFRKITSEKNKEKLSGLINTLMSEVLLDGYISKEELKYIKESAKIAGQMGLANLQNYLMSQKEGKYKQGASTKIKYAYGAGGKAMGVYNAGNTIRASGYVPNFANKAISDAINREKEAGIPSSKIRIDQSEKLINRKNPTGLAITNTIDEPRGLKDVPNSALAAGGFVPNFASSGQMRALQMEKLQQSMGPKRFSGAVDMYKSIDKLNLSTKLSAKEVKNLYIEQERLYKLFKTGQITKKQYIKSTAESATIIAKTTKESTVLTRALTGLNANIISTSKSSSVKQKSNQIIMANNAMLGGQGSGLNKEGKFSGIAGRLSGFGGFAAYTAASALSQQGGVAGDVGGALTKGLQVGQIAGLINPVFGLIAGGITALGAGVLDFLDKSDDFRQELDKMSSSFEKNRNAGNSYLQQLLALNEAQREGDTKKIVQAKKDLEAIYTEFENFDLAIALQKAGNNLNEVEKILEKFAAENVEKIKKQTAKTEAAEYETKANFRVGAVSEEQRKMGQNIIQKSYLSALSNLDNLPETFEESAKAFSQGFYKTSFKQRDDLGAVIDKNLLDNPELIDSLNNLFTAIVLETKAQKDRQKKTEKETELKNNINKLNQAIKSALSQSNLRIQGQFEKNKFGQDLYSSIIKPQREAMINQDVQSQAISQYRGQRIISSISEDEQKLSQIESVRDVLKGTFDDVNKVFENVNFGTANEDNKNLEIFSNLRNEIDKAISGTDSELFKFGKKQDSLKGLSPTFRGQQVFEGANEDYFTSIIEELNKVVNNTEDSNFTEEQKKEAAQQKKLAEDLIKVLKDGDSNTRKKLEDINKSILKSRIQQEIQSIQATRQQKQQTINQLSKGPLLKNNEEIVNVQKTVSSLLSDKTKGSSVEQLDSLNKLSEFTSQFESTETAFGDVSKFAIAQKNFQKNIQDGLSSLGFNMQDFMPSQVVDQIKGYIKEPIRTMFGDGTSTIQKESISYSAPRQTTDTEKLQLAITKAASLIKTNEDAMIQAAKRAASGDATNQDLANLQRFSFLENLQVGARQQLENRSREEGIINRASEKYLSFKAGGGQRQEGSTFSDFIEQERKMQTNVDVFKDLKKSISNVSGGEQLLQASLQKRLGIDPKTSQKDIEEKFRTISPEVMQQILGDLAPDKVTERIDELIKMVDDKITELSNAILSQSKEITLNATSPIDFTVQVIAEQNKKAEEILAEIEVLKKELEAKDKDITEALNSVGGTRPSRASRNTGKGF